MKRKLKQKIVQAQLIILANISMSGIMVLGFLQNTIYWEGKNMIPKGIALLSIGIIFIVALIFWHKKINPDTTWIYTCYLILHFIYACFIV